MILQNVIFTSELCDAEELYIRSKGSIEICGDILIMYAGAEISTYTYMNLFDADTWKKYTTLKNWRVHIYAEGDFEAELLHIESIYYIKLRARTDTRIYGIVFETNDDGTERNKEKYTVGAYHLYLSPEGCT